MSDYFDHLPSHERERIRKRMRSPEAYEKLRDKVKGPEDLEQEMKKSERMADVSFALESDRDASEKLKTTIEKDISEQGVEQILEGDHLSPEAKKQIEAGKFTVTISSHPSTHEDAMVIVPEGTVQEKIPVKVRFSDQYSGQVLSRA